MSRKVFDSSKQAGMQKDYTVKHYTPDSCAKYLLGLVPFAKTDFVIDAGSGIAKTWFKHIPTEHKEEIEIDDGSNFYEYQKSVDWVVGNPPFTEFVKFMFKSAEICNKGFAFLINHSRLNQVTPRRLQKLEEAGFILQQIHIVSVSQWFGRYYFLVFAKGGEQKIGYSVENFKH